MAAAQSYPASLEQGGWVPAPVGEGDDGGASVLTDESSLAWDDCELRPLPCDPLDCEPPTAEEPEWLDEWLESVEGEPADGGPVADRLPSDVLAAIDPGLALAAELEGIDPRTVDEYHLVEIVAGYQRLAAWSHARMAEIACCLSRRPLLNPRASLPTGDQVMNVTAQELAPRLGLSRFAARRLVENGRLFGLKLEDTGRALEQGRIDYPKACSIARLLKDQPDDVAWAVQQEVLPIAPHLTITQLEREVSRAIIAIDPLRATARHKQARDERRVHHPRPLPDGMASMTAILPATDAAGLDLALEAAARTAKASGDTRTIDQLRADALALLGHGALDHGFVGVAPGDPAEPRSHAQGALPGREVGDVASADGRAQDVASADGRAQNVAPADGQARDVAPDDGDDSGPPTFHTGNSFLRTPCMPTGSIGGRRAQVKVTVPLSVLIPFEQLDHTRDRLPGDSCADAGGAVAENGRDAVQATAAARSRDRSAFDDDGLPEDWYFGPPVEVAELDGYGPITPDVARALAHSGGTWQRLVTDPLSGALLDVGRTRYRPPAAIADLVRNRDGHCVFPACSTPAESCELDHIDAWAFGGITSADNLATLCPGDHGVKTAGAFQLRHLSDGSFLWTTPTGHRYVRDRAGRVTSLGRGGPGDSEAHEPLAVTAAPPF